MKTPTEILTDRACYTFSFDNESGNLMVTTDGKEVLNMLPLREMPAELVLHMIARALDAGYERGRRDGGKAAYDAIGATLEEMNARNYP